MSSILRSSKFIRYFVGLARNIVISNRQEVDGSLLQRSQHVASVFSNSFSTSSSNLQAGSTLERTVRRLDEDARRTGRISVKEIEEALSEIRGLKKVTTSQSLMVIRCCGNLVPEETPEHRTQLVEEIWNTLEKLGVPLDISHYNALLKVYLENEHKFSPTDFLAKLEKQGVEPNRVTYQRLIAGYCQMGDIAGATKILEFMKEKQLPVSEGVFNALILGHSVADDMESAEGMLGVMKQANLEPTNDTYCTLLCGYARHGDKEALDRLIKECKLKDVLLSDKDFLEVAYTAALYGHDDLVDEALKNVRNMTGYNQEAANTLLRLITKGKDEAAYKVFLTMQHLVRTDNSPDMSGHLLIKQLIKSNRPVDHILSMSERLAKDGHTMFGLFIAIDNSFVHGNIALTLDLLRAFKERNNPIRNHYFWPSLITAGKTGDTNSMIDILKKMVNEFDVPPTFETLKDHYLPYVKVTSPEEVLRTLLEAGVRRAQAVIALISNLITQKKLKEAMDLALQNPGINLKSQFLNRLVVDAIHSTGDVKSAVTLAHIMTSNSTGRDRVEEEDEAGTVEDFPSRFLIGVVTDSNIRNKTAEVLQEMLNHGLGISVSCAEYVESRLQGNQLTTEISDLLSKLSAGDISPAALKRTGSGTGNNISRNPVALERIKEKMMANNEPPEKIISIVRSIFQAYCFNGDLENALKTKQEWVEELKQELTPGWWASLLDVYCSKEDLKGAIECLENIKESSTEAELDTVKILRMAKLYIQNNQLDEAINLLKSLKMRKEIGFQARATSWQALQAVADTTKDPDLVKKLLQTLVEEKYIEISNVFLGPIIKAYLLRDDIEGAMKEFERCVQQYRATPWKNEIATRLIEKEDAVNLQTLVDLSTQVHGEINSLYDLVLSFVECGRIRQARKILETPGLRTRNSRIQIACERYKNEGQTAPLEGLVEATKDLPHIDRSEIYYNLLETYCQADNVDKAIGLWTQMQDEDVNVTDEFLIKLGGFLKSKGLEVPFEIPNAVAIEKDVSKEKTEPVKQNVSINKSEPPSLLTAAIKAKNVEEALKIKESLENSGKVLTRSDVTRLLELLIEKNQLREATALVTSLPVERFPVIRSLNYLVSRLALAGELDLLKQIGECLTEDLKKLTSFTNRYFTGALTVGKGKEELDKLEKMIDNTKTPEEVDEAAEAFPRGGIFGVLEASPSYHEQVSRIVEKYHNKGVPVAANCLCMFYLANGQTDKAREVYQRYNLSNSSRIMFQNVLGKARRTGNPKLVEELISLLKDAPAITPTILGLMYSNIINIYSTAGEFETALTKLEEALKTISVEDMHTNTLIKLKNSVEARNIPFRYTIPVKRMKESSSSSSSSSSDVEPKKSVAAKQ